MEWSFTINYFIFFDYINVSSKQIKGIGRLLVWKIPKVSSKHRWLPTQGPFSPFFTMISQFCSCDLGRRDPISSFRSETQLILANQRNLICMSVNAAGMNVWPNFCLGEQDRSQLLLSRDVKKERCSPPLAAGCHTRGEVRVRRKLTGGRGQRLRGRGPEHIMSRTSPPLGSQKSDSQLFSATTCMMDDVYTCRTHSQGCVYCVSMCDSRGPWGDMNPFSPIQ